MQTFKDKINEMRSSKCSHPILLTKIKQNYISSSLMQLIPISLRTQVDYIFLKNETVFVCFTSRIPKIEFDRFHSKMFIELVQSLAKKHNILQGVNKVTTFIASKNINSMQVNASWIYLNKKDGKDKQEKLKNLVNNSFTVTEIEEVAKGDFEIKCSDKKIYKMFEEIREIIRSRWTYKYLFYATILHTYNFVC